MAVINYNPRQLTVNFGGNILTGFMDGTFLTAERNEDTFERSTGSDGSVTRTRKNDRSGLVTLVLQAGAPSNQVLSIIAELDERLGDQVLPLLIQDFNGTTVIESEGCWIRKVATAEFADTASGREWIFECDELLMNIGSAVVL